MHKYFLVAMAMVLAAFGIAYAQCDTCHGSIEPRVQLVNMKSDYQRIIQLGGVLIDIETDASNAMSVMNQLKTRLNTLKSKATAKFGAGSPEVAEIDATIAAIKTQFTDAATAW